MSTWKLGDEGQGEIGVNRRLSDVNRRLSK